MIPKTSSFVLSFGALAALFAAAPAAIPAQVDFNQASASEALTAAQIETIAGVAPGSTAAIDGVALASGGELFIVHRDTLAVETLLRVDPADATGSSLGAEADLDADLGAPYDSSPLIMEGGLEADATGAQTLYFGDSGTGDFALLAYDLAGGTAAEVLRGNADLDDMSDFAALPTGQIVVARGAGGLGVVDPSAPSPAFELKISEADLIALLPGSPAEAPPESVAVDPTTGDVYVFAHDELVLFRVENILDASPAITLLDIPGWTGVVDLHDLRVDDKGNVFGFDEAAESIVIWDGTDTFEYALDEIAELAAGAGAPALAVTLWRGMAVRGVSATETDVFLASSTADYGVVRLRLGAVPAAVSDWRLYE